VAREFKDRDICRKRSDRGQIKRKSRKVKYLREAKEANLAVLQPFAEYLYGFRLRKFID